MRELIKDLLYRNRQERTLGEIEIISRLLELRTEYGLTPQANQAISVEISENARRPLRHPGADGSVRRGGGGEDGPTK